MTHDSEAVALKPCPFCGGVAVVQRFGNRKQSTIYECTECACVLETGEERDFGRAWNTRPDTPADNAHSEGLAAELEALVGLAQDQIELNLSNYDHDDACRLNAEALEIHDALTGLAPRIFTALREAEAMRGEVEGLREENEKLKCAHWFYLGEDCSSEACRFGIGECISEDFEWDNKPEGDHVLLISGARPVPDMWVALHYFTEAEKDARDDDEPFTYTVHSTEDEARAVLPSPPKQEQGA